MAKGKMPSFMMAKFEKGTADKKADMKDMKGMAKKGMAKKPDMGMGYMKGGKVKGKGM
jgi:hypothetical protein|tara:strand:- start:404 stop:577 length:174 start_codon:yes stop_codon:yes gene_type:complete